MLSGRICLQAINTLLSKSNQNLLVSKFAAVMVAGFGGLGN